MKKSITSLFLLLLLSLIIIFPQNAVSGATKGLLLWYRTLLPTLLPFMILTDLVIAYDAAGLLTKFLYPVFGRLFRLSQNGCFAMIVGLVCGYPMGAKVSADLVRSDKITEQEGQYLLSFCNLASPAYINGFLLNACLHVKSSAFKYILCIYIPVFLIAFLFRKTHTYQQNNTPSSTQKNDTPETLEQCIMCGLKSIAMLGGYVILFAMAQTLLNAVTNSLPDTLRLFLAGLLEITNGTEAISDSMLSSPIQIILSLTLTSFGGCSCLFQTKSMLSGTNLSILKYMIVKIVSAMMTALLAILLFL
ncbi:MAG TPA: transporter [Lachnospiraceae bacterium]|nr:transporter [Lachnospiraceae bacterium]